MKRFILAVTVAALAAGATPGSADAVVRPGAETLTDGGQCTGNFIFRGGGETYLGQAAHCSGTGTATDTNGCESGTLPIGTPVTIEGATAPGTLAYSSWNTMQSAGETDENTCQYNDLALIRLSPADAAAAVATIPHWGGPTGLRTTPLAAGEQVRSYGNSSLRLGIDLLKPKTGITLGTEAGGWNHPVYTLTPGIPGDSGSAFIDSQNRAFGVLSTLALAPLAGSNGVSDLNKMLAYARTHGGPDVAVVNG